MIKRGFFLLGFLAAVLPGVAPAAEPPPTTVSLPRNCHPWGRFSPGAWNQVRKTTEDFDEKGNVRSISRTETTTTLEEVTDAAYTLTGEVCVEVAGKRFTPQTRTVTFGYNGEANGQRATFKRLGDAELEVGERKVPCVLLEAAFDGGEKKVLSKIHYANTLAPFVLRRETHTTAAASKAESLTTVSVLATEMPHEVRGEIKSTALVRTVESRDGKVSMYTVEVVCVDVPGGVVAHASKELDERGRIVRRSTLELLDYGLAEERRGHGILFRNRPRRVNTGGTP
jgi:hypothetical protein